MSKIQVWANRTTGELRTIEWNPCKCCPKSTIECWGTRWREKGSYSYKSRKQATKAYKQLGWFFLGYL